MYTPIHLHSRDYFFSRGGSVADSDPPPFHSLALSPSLRLSLSSLHASRVRNYSHTQREQYPLVIILTPPLAPADSTAATRPSARAAQPWQLANSGSCAEYSFPAWLRPLPRENVACRDWSCTNRARSTLSPRRAGKLPVTLGQERAHARRSPSRLLYSRCGRGGRSSRWLSRSCAEGRRSSTSTTQV